VVYQRVLEHCTDEQKQRGIMEEILRSTCILAQDQYGNYVVQVFCKHLLLACSPDNGVFQVSNVHAVGMFSLLAQSFLSG
jgi:hypothetical protein